MLLLPLRTLLIPKMPFTSDELAILDGPAASPFVSLKYSNIRSVAFFAVFILEYLAYLFILDYGVRRRNTLKGHMHHLVPPPLPLGWVGM
jgi:hypothetical protein